jgi:hypothetical protein
MEKTSVHFGKGVLALACSVATFAAQAVEVSTVEELVSAITAVNAGGSDTTINVRPGTYDVSGVHMNADGHLYVGKTCVIQGTDATSWTERDSRDTVVVFDAKDVNRIVYVNQSVASPRFYHLTFQNGHAHTAGETQPAGWDAYTDTYARGGAITHAISGNSPASKAVVSNCVFRSNNGGRQGGGTFNCNAWNCFYTNNITTSCGSAVINSAIYNCLIVDNRTSGGNGAARNCGPISNCVFIANRSTGGNGGAAYGGGAVVTDCVFSNNWTSGSGGALCRENGNWTVSGCRFYGNAAAGNAGACDGIQTLTNCYFEGNVCSNSSGGAVFNASNCVRCCTFVGNKASQYGGAAGSSVLENCLFLTNSAPTTGGAVYQGSAKNCTFIGNRSANYGGAAGGSVLTNCVFAENFSTNGGALYNAVAVNCAFTNNRAGNQGGAMYKGTAEGCDFCGNEAFGGDWSYGGGGCHSATFVTNCTFRRCVAWTGVSSTNAYGGGVKDCRNVVGCFFDDCHAAKGGAGCNSCLYDCVITNCWSPQNWSDAADAVGMRGNASDAPCEIKRSKIYGRCVTAAGTGRAIIKMYAEDCEIVGGSVVWGNANRCVFRGTDGVPAACCENSSFTNCLFAGCYYSSGYLFTAVSNMVNCTVTGCKGQLFNGMGDIVNSLFLGNDYNGEQVDLSGNGNSRTFRNCLYRTKPDTFTVSGEGNIQIAAGRGTGFVGPEENPEHPYAINYSSPARDKGLTINWPGGTTDLAGQVRVNGQVDIGCYECWLPSVGTRVVFR